jgi:hypothetical protein
VDYIWQKEIKAKFFLRFRMYLLLLTVQFANMLQMAEEGRYNHPRNQGSFVVDILLILIAGQ